MVAWVNDEWFAVTFLSTFNNTDQYRLGMINAASGQLIELAETVSNQPAGDPCVPISEHGVVRIDSQTFSFIQRCTYEAGGLFHWHHKLFLFDIESLESTLVQEFPRSKRILNSDFSPVSDQLVVARGAPPVKSEMFLFVPDESKRIHDLYEETTQLLGSYRSVRSPVWSPDGNITAFASGDGTKEFEDSPLSLMGEPIDIVTVNPVSLQHEVLVGGFTNSAKMKWAPDGSGLGIAAELQGTSGIWIVDFETETIQQVWHRLENFDWSPDSNSMVIMDDPDGGSTFDDPHGELSPLPHSPVIISIP